MNWYREDKVVYNKKRITVRGASNMIFLKEIEFIKRDEDGISDAIDLFLEDVSDDDRKKILENVMKFCETTTRRYSRGGKN